MFVFTRRVEPEPAGLTLRWFTQDSGTHTLLRDNRAACDPQIQARWPFESHWKSDLPPDAVPCRACEAILAGEAPVIDTSYIRALATDMITGWIGGWTEPAEGEPQRRISVEQANPGVVILRIEGARFTDEPDRRFAIAVEAEEITS